MNRFEQFLNKPIESISTPEQRLESWQNDFTDPANHDKNRFTYLVHGLASPIGRAIQRVAMIEQGLKKPDVTRIDLERQPEEIDLKPRISASVIDKKHRATWGDVGLIIESPPENIRGVYPSDAGTPWHDDKPGDQIDLPCTVEELLKQTTPGQYNEIVLTGITQAGKVELKGFFVKIFPDGDYVEPEMASKIRGLALHLNLPLIEIIDQSPRMSPTEIKREQDLKDRGLGKFRYNG